MGPALKKTLQDPSGLAAKPNASILFSGKPYYAHVTAIVRGDVAAVKAAVDAGVRGGEKVGEVIATHVIARPHVNIDLVLPLGRKDEAEGAVG